MILAALSTYSLPVALGNAADKVLLDAYTESPATWRAFAAVKSTNDFKDHTGGSDDSSPLQREITAKRNSIPSSRARIPAIGYARRSTDLQDRSIPDQKDYVEKRAKEHGYKIIRWYVGDAISGTSARGRDDFTRMIETPEKAATLTPSSATTSADSRAVAPTKPATTCTGSNWPVSTCFSRRTALPKATKAN